MSDEPKILLNLDAPFITFPGPNGTSALDTLVFPPEYLIPNNNLFKNDCFLSGFPNEAFFEPNDDIPIACGAELTDPPFAKPSPDLILLNNLPKSIAEDICP